MYVFDSCRMFDTVLLAGVHGFMIFVCLRPAKDMGSLRGSKCGQMHFVHFIQVSSNSTSDVSVSQIARMIRITDYSKCFSAVFLLGCSGQHECKAVAADVFANVVQVTRFLVPFVGFAFLHSYTG